MAFRCLPWCSCDHDSDDDDGDHDDNDGADVDHVDDVDRDVDDDGCAAMGLCRNVAVWLCRAEDLWLWPLPLTMQFSVFSVLHLCWLYGSAASIGLVAEFGGRVLPMTMASML